MMMRGLFIEVGYTTKEINASNMLVKVTLREQMSKREIEENDQEMHLNRLKHI